MSETRDQIQRLFLCLSPDQQEQAVHLAQSMLEAEQEEAVAAQE